MSDSLSEMRAFVFFLVIIYVFIFVLPAIAIAFHRKLSAVAKFVIFFIGIVAPILSIPSTIYAGAFGATEYILYFFLLAFLPIALSVIWQKPITTQNLDQKYEFVTVSEFAEKNNLSELDVIKNIREGIINGRLIDKQWYVSVIQDESKEI